MPKKKIRRSPQAYQRKMIFVWIVSLFFLVLLVVLQVIIVYNQTHPANRALSAELDYSKIHFDGLAIGDEISDEIAAQRVIDAEFDYSWHNIAISVDENNRISRLGFYTTEPLDNDKAGNNTNISNVVLDYRDYPLSSVSDFVMYFGDTKVTNFDHYKYLSYQHNDYILDLTLYDGTIYNVVLYKKSAVK